MKFSKLLIGSVIAMGAAATVAYAAGTSLRSTAIAPQADEPTPTATATWAMGSTVLEEVQTATYSDESLFESSSLELGSNCWLKTANTLTTDANGSFKTTNIGFTEKTSDNSYFTYTVTLARPAIPVSVSFLAGGDKTSYTGSVKLISGDKTEMLDEAASIKKATRSTADAATDFSFAYDVPATFGEVTTLTLRLDFNVANNYGVNMSNVVLTFKEPSQGGSGDDEVCTAHFYHVPGVLDIVDDQETLTTSSNKHVEKKDPFNIGFVYDGDWMTFNNVHVTEAGAYNIEMPIRRYHSTATMRIEVRDNATNRLEAYYDGLIPGQDSSKYPTEIITLTGRISEGVKTIKYSFVVPAGGEKDFALNFRAPKFVRTGEGEDLPYDPAEDYDVIPGTLDVNNWSYSGGNSSFGVEGGDHVGFVTNGAVATHEFYAKEAGVYNMNINFNWFQNPGKMTIEIKDRETGAVEAKAVYEITGKHEAQIKLLSVITEGVKDITLSMSNDAGGFIANWESPTFIKVADNLDGESILTSLKVGRVSLGNAVIEQLAGEEHSAVVDGYVFTAVPELAATFAVGEALNTECVLSDDNTEATYTFENLGTTYTLTVKGLNIYTLGEKDERVEFKYNSGSIQNDSWTNGSYTLSNSNDGWTNEFKFSRNSDHTWTVPGDVIVKQLIFKGLTNAYDNESATIVSVSSEGAEVLIPSHDGWNKGDAGDLVVNIANHQGGAPIDFRVEGGGQPAFWFEFVYESLNPATAPAPVEISATSTEGKNHAVVKFNFDRVMADNVATYTDMNGTVQTVKAEGGSTELLFSTWNLPAGETVLSIDAAVDKYGNTASEPITYTLNVTEAELAMLDTDRFIVVTNVDELRAAVASLDDTNKTADSPLTYIYMLNGDYDLGGSCYEGTNDEGKPEWKNDENSALLPLNKVYNVALIGESQSGVVLHGTRTGISYPVLSTRYSTNIYMANFTLRNDFDFDKERAGVAVAHGGGNLDIMQNVTLQSQQDTQVTGQRGYYVDCTIHGSVDYVCGGGDHFYDHCTFVQESAGAITAPQTSSANKHGYVFLNCTIRGAEGYTLGRPWQNEPRAFWLHTVMEALPAENGWGSMGEMITHFFEYGSMDTDGNLLDLSKRQNSPTSTNSYSPILPEEHVGYFTVENVLGGTDSWLPTEVTAVETPAAPESVKQFTHGLLKWSKVEGAIGYVIRKGNSYATHVSGDITEWMIPAEEPAPAARIIAADPSQLYSVAAVNASGRVGEVKAAEGLTSGIEGIEADAAAEAEYYNLQGVRVGSDARGILIRVINGKAEKIVK